MEEVWFPLLLSTENTKIEEKDKQKRFLDQHCGTDFVTVMVATEHLKWSNCDKDTTFVVFET